VHLLVYLKKCVISARNIEYTKAFQVLYCGIEKSFSEVLQGDGRSVPVATFRAQFVCRLIQCKPWKVTVQMTCCDADVSQWNGTS